MLLVRVVIHSSSCHNVAYGRVPAEILVPAEHLVVFVSFSAATACPNAVRRCAASTRTATVASDSTLWNTLDTIGCHAFATKATQCWQSRCRDSETSCSSMLTEAHLVARPVPLLLPHRICSFSAAPQVLPWPF